MSIQEKLEYLQSDRAICELEQKRYQVILLNRLEKKLKKKERKANAKKKRNALVKENTDHAEQLSTC
jgi:hypothetical protein